MNPIDWPEDYESLWPNFTAEEVECKCGCGFVPEVEFMHLLQRLRDRVAFPLQINSGFRCIEYDRKIGGVGAHSTGLAVDIGVGREDAFHVVKWATHFGFTGIGVKGSGDTRFIHIDAIPVGPTRPTIWSY